MASVRKSADRPRKVTDEVAAIRCAAGIGAIREEVWKDADGVVVRYNLAFINFELFDGDNGRVFGYDTAHKFPHRHFAGIVEAIEPAEFDEVYDRFIAEVTKLKKRRML